MWATKKTCIRSPTGRVGSSDLPVKADYLRNASGRGPFAYCTGGTLLLGQIVQRAARKPLDQYFDERLFRPLGIRAAAMGPFTRRRIHDAVAA